MFSCLDIHVVILMSSTRVFFRNVRLRTSTNVYITGLSISGMVCGAFMQPIAISNSIRGEIIFGFFGCSVYGFLGHVVSYVIVCTMALTALNRFFRVVKPQKYRRLFSTKRSIGYIAALWVFVVVVISVPLIFGFGEFGLDKVLSGCAFVFATDAGRYGFYGLLGFLFGSLPMGVIITCYYKVFKTIRQHNINLQSSQPDTVSTALGVEEVKVTRTLFALFIGFMFSWVPMNIFVTVRFVFDGFPPVIGGMVT